MFSGVHPPWFYNTNHTAVHKCIKLSCYNSERSYQETSCLHWWNVSSLSIDDVLILQLDVEVDLIANVQWKLFNKESCANNISFNHLNSQNSQNNNKTKCTLVFACSFALHGYYAFENSGLCIYVFSFRPVTVTVCKWTKHMCKCMHCG